MPFLRKKYHFIFLNLLFLNFYLVGEACACSVCFTDSQSPLTMAIRIAMMTLLAILLFIFLLVFKFLFDVRKRLKILSES